MALATAATPPVSVCIELPIEPLPAWPTPIHALPPNLPLPLTSFSSPTRSTHWAHAGEAGSSICIRADNIQQQAAAAAAAQQLAWHLHDAERR